MGEVVDRLTVIGMVVLLVVVVTVPIWSWYASKRYVNGDGSDDAAGSEQRGTES